MLELGVSFGRRPNTSLLHPLGQSWRAAAKYTDVLHL